MELSEPGRRALAELELEIERAGPPKPDGPDLVVAEMYSGDCRRELSAVRDDLAHTRERYRAAVLNARAAGFSWGEIGAIVGVSRQQLHRQYSALSDQAAWVAT